LGFISLRHEQTRNVDCVGESVARHDGPSSGCLRQLEAVLKALKSALDHVLQATIRIVDMAQNSGLSGAALAFSHTPDAKRGV
jgi:hypothetical protein